MLLHHYGNADQLHADHLLWLRQFLDGSLSAALLSFRTDALSLHLTFGPDLSALGDICDKAVSRMQDSVTGGTLPRSDLPLLLLRALLSSELASVPFFSSAAGRFNQLVETTHRARQTVAPILALAESDVNPETCSTAAFRRLESLYGVLPLSCALSLTLSPSYPPFSESANRFPY